MDNSNVDLQVSDENNDLPPPLSLLGDAASRAAKINFAPAPLEELTAPKSIGDLCKVAAAQQKEQQALLKQHQDLIDRIKKLDSYIEEKKKEKANLMHDLSLTSEDYKIAAKPLIKAVKKYSTCLDMQISINQHENEQFFVAAVKFSTKPQSKPINFIIDLKNRNILDFDAETALGADEAGKLKQQAKTEDGWDLDIVLKKLKDSSI
ncbi:unnamed protein product [Ceutorhynchus assimilis]|uniref:Kinetochore protein SPC25 n=1 Tax=Ceutorhynchus assimilis TaxID=467358 RepID=A0A9P0DE47_9CUCU|nr:unnamed protein product [Ceutorhynchus assimilis]